MSQQLSHDLIKTDSRTIPLGAIQFVKCSHTRSIVPRPKKGTESRWLPLPWLGASQGGKEFRQPNSKVSAAVKGCGLTYLPWSHYDHVPPATFPST